MPPAEETWAPKSTRPTLPARARSLPRPPRRLAERDFRLLFTATTITTVGDRLAAIALAFAVLDVGSATDLGIVLASSQAVEAVVLVLGGVLSDRLPRNLVLVGASLVQAAAQAATAAVVLSGGTSIWLLVGLQAVYGVGSGMVVPAEIGLVPQTVSAGRLQQANALQGMSRNIVGVLGPALGGALVLAGSPGVALAADAASFLACAVLLARIRVPRRAGEERPGYLHELREGWREFRSRTWLWSTVVVLIPLGMAFVGPVAAAVGVEETIWLSVAIFLACTAVIASMPSVRAIAAPAPEGEATTIPGR